MVGHNTPNGSLFFVSPSNAVSLFNLFNVPSIGTSTVRSTEGQTLPHWCRLILPTTKHLYTKYVSSFVIRHFCVGAIAKQIKWPYAASS